MYAAFQNTFDQLRDKARSSQYTKDVVNRLDGYTQRVVGLRDAAFTKVQTRRDAAVAIVKQYQDMVRDIVVEKRTNVSAKVNQAKAQAGDFVEAQRARATDAVVNAKRSISARGNAVVAQVKERKSQLTSSVTVASETVLGVATSAIALSLGLVFRVDRAAREAAPPRALETLDNGVAMAKPYALKALNTVHKADLRFGGYGTALANRVSHDVSSKLGAEEAAQPVGEGGAQSME